MAIKVISKTTEIDAPADTVWHVLFDDSNFRIWASEFNPGTHAVTNWQTGSKVQFLASDGSGLLGEILESNQPRKLSISYLGTINRGTPDFDSDAAKQMKHAKETYLLNEANGVTRLEIACDMEEKYYNDMSEAWDRALERIKDLAESE